MNTGGQSASRWPPNPWMNEFIHIGQNWREETQWYKPKTTASEGPGEAHYVDSRETSQGSQWRAVCHGHQPNRFIERPCRESKTPAVLLWLPRMLTRSFGGRHHTCKPKAFLFQDLTPFAKILCYSEWTPKFEFIRSHNTLEKLVLLHSLIIPCAWEPVWSRTSTHSV